MPPALAVRPDDALAAARGSMLVGATLPPVYAEAAKLAAPDRRPAGTRAWRWSSAAPTPPRSPTQLTKARGDLDDAHQPERSRKRRRPAANMTTLKTKLAEIAAQAADFQALVSRVAALRRQGGGRRRHRHRYGAPIRVPWGPCQRFIVAAGGGNHRRRRRRSTPRKEPKSRPYLCHPARRPGDRAGRRQGSFRRPLP